MTLVSVAVSIRRLGNWIVSIKRKLDLHVLFLKQHIVQRMRMKSLILNLLPSALMNGKVSAMTKYQLTVFILEGKDCQIPGLLASHLRGQSTLVPK